MSFHRFKWFSNAALRKTILCSYSLRFSVPFPMPDCLFDTSNAFSMCSIFIVFFFFLGKFETGNRCALFSFRRNTSWGGSGGESGKKNKIKIKLPKRNRYYELFNAIVCMCVPVSIIAMGRYAILCFSYLLVRLKTEPKKKTSGKKYNKMRYFFIYSYVWVYYNIEKQNGNECTELEGGLNATHQPYNKSGIYLRSSASVSNATPKWKLPKNLHNKIQRQRGRAGLNCAIWNRIAVRWFMYMHFPTRIANARKN